MALTLQEAKEKKKQIKLLFDTIDRNGCIEEICGDDVTIQHPICSRDIKVHNIVYGYNPNAQGLTKNFKLTVQKTQQLLDKIIGDSELYLFIHPQNGIIKFYLKEHLHYYFNEAKKKTNWKHVFFSNQRTSNKKVFEIYDPKPQRHLKQLSILMEVLRNRKYSIKVLSIKDDQNN